MDLADGRRDAVALLPASGRLREMHGRLARRLESAGLEPAARERILDVHAGALLHRLAVLGDDEHFEVLHPSRTLLILLDDCDVTAARVLEAAASVESEHARLRLPRAGPDAQRVPTPATTGDALVEELVTASEETRLVALAERLDHARHLHLRPDSEWAPFHRQIGDVYLPLAQRTHARLARRYAWWWSMFRRRFLEGRENG